jgi:transposase-like protein
MSTKKKKPGKSPSTGIRYTDAKKQEIVAFVAKYNAANGRGGQSAASAKYKVTPLTISGWLKSAGVKTPKAKKAAKKAVKKATKGGKGKKGVRYSPEFKNSVVDFVESYNAKNGRGGQNQASKKFKLSVLTVSAWLKAAGSKKPGRKKITAKATKVAKKAAKSSGKDLAAFKAALLAVIKSF